jgi:uncharacterized protein (DUF362 family)
MIEDNVKVYVGKVNPELETLSNEINSGLSYFKDYMVKIIKTKSKTVILKPNILPTKFINNGLAVTNPIICAKIADFLKEVGFKRIILAEGTTLNKKGEADTLEGMKNNGFSDFLDIWEQFDMNKDEVGKWFEIYSPGDDSNIGDPFDIEVGISKLALEYPIVSVAKFKSHDVLGLTLSVKNLMGCLCKARRKSTGEILHEGSRVKSYLHGYGPRNPYELPEKELNWTTSKTALAINLNRMAKNIIPAFSILDAAPAMEGIGPLYGKPNQMNLLLCSNDSVALDSVACKLVGIDLEYNQYIKNLARLNLGFSDYNKIDTINQELVNDIIENKTFKFHEWFQYSKFTPQEIELLHKLS